MKNLDQINKPEQPFNSQELALELVPLNRLLKAVEDELVAVGDSPDADKEFAGLLIEYSQILGEKIRLIHKLNSVSAAKSSSEVQAAANELKDIVKQKNFLEKELEESYPDFYNEHINAIQKETEVAYKLN